jgi:PAS domain S-box-containing protein
MFSRSLMIQLSLAIVLITSAVLTGFGLYRYQKNLQKLPDQLDQNLELTAKRLSISLRTPIFNFSEYETRDIILSEMEDPNIVAITVSLEDGSLSKFVYGRSIDNKPAPVKSFIPKNGEKHIRRKILYETDELGIVEIYMTPKYLEERLRNTFFSDLSQIIILDAILIFLVILFVRFRFIRPIMLLTSAASEISKGNLDQKIDVKSRDEIGVLAKSFTIMRDAIQKQIIDLNNEIDERKEVEKQLRLSEKRFRQFSNATWEAIVIHDNGLILQANELYYELFGYSEEELHERNAIPLTVTPDSMRYMKDKIASDDPGPYEVTGRKKDGTEFPIEIRIRVMEYHGRMVRVAAIRDLTEQKKAEEELKHLRNYLKNIVDSMPSILVGVNEQGQITQWNLEAERTTGVGSSEASGKKLGDVFPQLSHAMGKIIEAVKNRQIQKDTKVPLQIGRVTRMSDITIYPLVTNGIEGAVIRVDDITERVRIEEMIIQSEKMLSVGGLAAGMAHEINNPLGGILQNVQVLGNRMRVGLPKNEEVAEACGTTMKCIEKYAERRGLLSMVDMIMDAGKRAAKIVENMLSFSRKGQGRFESHHLSELIDRTIELAGSDYDLKKKYDFRQIEIIREYDQNLPEVFCEQGKIQQVFLNLFKNAAHAMVSIKDSARKPCLTIRTRFENQIVCIEVEDNGVGMDEETRKRIFEPFFTTKEVGSGTGLGLSISYFIVTEEHGGVMTVESFPGKGAKFIIRLPIHPVQSEGDADSMVTSSFRQGR